MSRGIGRVGAKLLAIFVDEPADFHPTSKLCKRVYGVAKVEKKHRVAVLRGMQTLVERDKVSIWRLRLENEKCDDEWFNGSRIRAPRHSSPLRSRRS
ncbi:hypothetical protein SAMN05444159_1834 [Bradyrhizobium lablabi]|uniref:Uncharacterized protein n=1 Tax=Bradyrhizobium lablabi TaxID=722472 RepID=A0A1M6N2B2_9BRAD|nr:hypothetical protein SAMN05444159_1834 [Bradyrhizobium lablabi]